MVYPLGSARGVCDEAGPECGGRCGLGQFSSVVRKSPLKTKTLLFLISDVTVLHVGRPASSGQSPSLRPAMKHGCLCCSESRFLFQITERPCRKGGTCLPPANPGFEDLASFPRGVLLAAGGRPGAVTHACGLFLGTSRIQGRGLRAGGSPVRRCRGDLPCPRSAGWCRRAASVAMHICGGRHGERGRLSSLDGAADALPSPHHRICAAPATLLAGAPSGSPVFPPPRGLRVAWAWPPSAPGGTGRHQVGGGLCSLGLQPSGLSGTSRRQAFGLLLFSSLRCPPSSWWLSPMLGGPSL